MNKPELDENFVKEFVEESGTGYDENELVFILRDLLIAGTETSSMTICWALIYLANNADIQERVQKEIDSVVSRDRLPSLSDKPKLPYTEAVMFEVMRVRTIGPLSVPRATLCDTEVAGYKIPSKTLVLANLWSAHMDPKVWSEPEEFRPERFYDEQTGQAINGDRMISFSFGKRACLGEVLARQEVFLLFASLFQKFTVLPPEDLLRLSTDMVVGGTIKPVPFKLRFVSR